MSAPSEDRKFWDRVEHELRVSRPGMWRLTLLLLRLGMAMVVLSTAYLLFFYILGPAKGYFFSSIEMAVSPIYWMLAGTVMIICGAYLRFRAMGPIVDNLKVKGLD